LPAQPRIWGRRAGPNIRRKETWPPGGRILIRLTDGAAAAKADAGR
jgi:hypothetical protein